MFLFDDLVNITENILGIVVKPVKIITKKVVDVVEETTKDILGD